MKMIITLLSIMSVAFSATANTQETRIISAGSSITELLYALEAQQQLVAIDMTSRGLDPEGTLPQVGYFRTLSAEGLLALNPTHLIGPTTMGPEATLILLNNAQVNVVTVPEGDTKQALFQRIDVVAQVIGKQQAANELKASLDKKFEILENRDKTHAPKVLFAMLSKGRPATIAGRETSIDTVISYAGAVNPAHDQMTSYKQLSIEAIVEMQPDYLLVSQRAWDALEGYDGIIKHFPLLAVTPAGNEKRIIPITSSAIIGGLGLESLELSEQLFGIFYP